MTNVLQLSHINKFWLKKGNLGMQIKREIKRKKVLSKIFAMVIISGSISFSTNIGLINAQPNENSININNSRQNNKNEWVKENNQWYYYENGNKKTGWLKDKDGSWYWLGNDGRMVSNQILNINGVYYRFFASGRMSDQKDMKVAKVKPCDFLNMRTGPGTSYSVVDKVYTNNLVEVLDSSNGWSKVKLGNSAAGWVSNEYITMQNSSNTETINEKVQKVIDISKNQIGKPYAWGSSGPNSFDCSGLMYYSYKNGANVTLPRTSKEQSRAGTKIEKSNLRAGDLVFFNTSGSGISHVGMYLGDGEFIHSTQPGDTVKVHKLDSGYYARTYVTARRIVS